jgi:hypothetical protein
MVSSAVQFIALSSGGFKDQWIATQQAVRNLRQLGHNSIQNGQQFIEPEVSPERNIFLRRRVFTKVPPTGIRPSSDLHVGDDPDGLCANLPQDWVLSGHLQIGRKVANGMIVKCSPLIISVGDFVDVALELDVGTGDKYGRTHIHFGITHVVQLMKATEVEKVKSPFSMVDQAAYMLI